MDSPTVATYTQQGCKKAKIDRPKNLSPRENMSGVATNFYVRKTLGKKPILAKVCGF